MAEAFTSSRHRFPEWHASCDPAGSKLGSGGGLVHALHEDWQALGSPGRFSEWVVAAPKTAVMAGGQSRRLPAYAATGKVLIPMPVLRWSTGQRIDGTLLDFMVPAFSRILDAAGESYPLMACSGDVLLKFPDRLPRFPVADVLAIGMWVSPETAGDFGVFFSRREMPGKVEFFLQKPSLDEIRAHGAGNLFTVDAGVWLLGARALRILLARCGWDEESNGFRDGRVGAYEMYAEFGPALGCNPTRHDPEISALSAAVVPLSGAEFHHLGTSRQLIESLSALQNRELDQIRSGPIDRKPHPDVYVLNADFAFTTRGSSNRLLWVENATLLPDEKAGSHQVITGVPPGFPRLDLPDGVCLDVAPIGQDDFCIRFYGFEDRFCGAIDDERCLWFRRPASEWFRRRGINPAEAGLAPSSDIQMAPLFPVVSRDEASAEFLLWLHDDDAQPDECHKALFLRRRLSAMQICEKINIARLMAQRDAHLRSALPVMRANHRSNPFFRLDLSSVAATYPADRLEPLKELQGLDASRDAMFRSAVLQASDPKGAALADAEAFALLRMKVLESVRPMLRTPRKTTLEDQIVWGRSPARLDLAGGWTDTPPYCFQHGGSVINIAADINGQPPVQVFIRVAAEPRIVLRSIDIGAELRIESYEDLHAFDRPGDPFALAKAALCLAGFHPHFADDARHRSLREQLMEFGGGLEISLLAAAPKGSGLGTSSILAATLLGAISDACGLGWDRADVILLVLAIEQMLTTCGGWQDQAGGVHRGIKLIDAGPGFTQEMSLRWAPETEMALAASQGTALLYFTGTTRMASGILREIVRGMFLNSSTHLDILSDIRANSGETFEAILRGRWDDMTACVDRSWRLNCRLDKGTNPPGVAAIFDAVKDFTAAAKLLGAGGGGYALFFAKDDEAAIRLRRTLEDNPPNAGARFVNFSISQTGLQITRS